MTRRLVLGIAGFRHSGKSTLADILVAHHGFRKTSPIDPGKRFGIELGFSYSCMFGSSSQRDEPHPYLRMLDGSPLTGRMFLDGIGVAVREVHPDLLLWASMRGDGDLVNESCRFAPEWESVRAAGGKLIRRKGGTYIGDAYDREVAAMPDSYWDAVIDEQPSLETLRQVIAVLVAGWRSADAP